MMSTSQRRHPAMRSATSALTGIAGIAAGVRLLPRILTRGGAEDVAAEFDAAARDAVDVATATVIARVGHRAVVTLPGGAAMVLHDVPRCAGPGWAMAVSGDRRCLLAVPGRVLARSGRGLPSAGAGGCDGREPGGPVRAGAA